MATVVRDQARLVLDAFAAIFQNNLVSKDLVTWNKFTSEMQDTNNLEVVENVGPRYNVTETVNGVANLTGGVQDSVFGSERYAINRIFGSSMGYSDWQKVTTLGAAAESEALKNAALNMAEKIDAHILRTVVLASNNWLGDGVAPVSTFDDIAGAYTRMKEEGVEDSDMRAVLSWGDKQALGSAIVSDNASLPDEGSGTFRNGFQGKVAGIPTLFTQQLPSLQVGTRAATGALTAGTTDAPVTYQSVSISAAPGQYLTQVLNVNVGGATATVKDGEVFTIAGVYAYDNRAGKALNHLQQFRVVGDATATGSVAALRVFPAIITSGPNQTVAQAPTNTAAVTFLGAASAVLQPRAVTRKSAVIVNTADLIMPATGSASRKSLSQLPLSVRMWKHSDFGTGDHSIRFDVALTANVRANGRPSIVRING